MKFMLIILAVFFSATACIQEEGGCVNITDCPEGYTCEEGVCIPSESWDGTSQNDTSGIPDTSNGNDATTVNDDNSDQSSGNDEDGTLPPQDEEMTDNENDGEISDESPDETPDEVPDEADCDPGWHLEEEGDDENGNGKRDCAQNVTCITEPCNGNGTCAETEWSVTCDCYDGYDGRWCDECATGYLLSTVDSKCKADCNTGDYGCTGNEECKVDGTTNEAGCDCKEGFTGTDCSQCDPAVYCNSHGTCSASGGNPTCICATEYTGADCSSCAEDYINNGSGVCIEGCDSSCGQSGGLINEESHGTCVVNGSSAECQCDPGWKDPFITFPPMIPECSECNNSSPPPEYATNGCPASCKDGDGVYQLCGSNGDCYYKSNGDKYCICDGGYVLDNGNELSGTCIPQ